MLKIIDLLLFYILNWSVAWILTHSMLFEEPRAWLSEWLAKKSQWNTDIKEWNSHPILAFIYDKTHYLINCIVCTSIWTAFVLCFVVQNSSYLRIGNNLTDYFLISLSSSFFTIIFTKTIEYLSKSDLND